MASKDLDATCPKCEARFRGVPARSFLGFQRFTCPACSKQFEYPLSSGLRVTYRVITALLVISFLDYAAAGYMVLPGTAALIALLRDARIRKRMLSPSGKDA